ncbi:MAG: hypothetical protein E6J24_16865 [Chloroflexi bacterium]|nr:MAG: hypothetical protein E6J24_16865 [Chloroflexota bacterium]
MTSGCVVDALELAPDVTDDTPRTPLAIGTSKLPALSNAIRPIERWKKMPLPGTSAQVFPPSVDLKTPTPASESPEAFGSPVPT